jgi:hypothetical protein
MRISIPYGGRYKVYKVLHEEPIPRFLVKIVPDYIASVPARGFADTPSDIRQLQTHEDEVWVLEYDQPYPALFGVGIGGAENRLFKSYKSLPDLFYPPTGEVAVSQSLSAGTPAILIAPPAAFAQLPLYYVRQVVVTNAGTAAAVVEFSQATDDTTTRVLRVLAPAGANTVLDRLELPIRGALSVASTEAVDVTVVVRWEPYYHKLVVGLGERIYMRVVNPLSVVLTQFAVSFSGVRYRVKYEGERDEPEGEVLTLYPHR